MLGQSSDEHGRPAGARKRTRPVVDPTPVSRSSALAGGARPHVSRRRPGVSQEPRVDPTRVTGPIRLVLEPLLWVAFVCGVIWLLVALDPGARTPATGVPLYQYTLPLAILVGSLLVISTVTALLWLPTSTTATRARTSFAGLGMLASGWLFAKVDPVETTDFVALSWLCIGVGVLLVTICSVPWPTTYSVRRGTPGPAVKAVAGLLLLGAALVALVAWETAQRGLVGRPPGAETAWDELMPLLGLIVLLAAGARVALRLPTRQPTARHHA